MCRAPWNNEIPDQLSFNLDCAAVEEYQQWLYSHGNLEILSGRLNSLSKDNLSVFMRDALRLHSVASELDDEFFLDVTKTVIAAGWHKAGIPIYDPRSTTCKSKALTNFLPAAIDAIYEDETISEQSRLFFLEQFLPVMTDISPFNDFDFEERFPKKFYQELGLSCLWLIQTGIKNREPFSIMDT